MKDNQNLSLLFIINYICAEHYGAMPLQLIFVSTSAQCEKSMEQLYVRRKGIGADEHRTGFKGIGKHCEERELRVFSKEGCSCKPW